MFFLETRQLVTPGDVGWQTVDVSTYIPEGSSGVILKIFNVSTTTAYDAEVRKYGSEQAIGLSLSAYYGSFSLCAVDASRRFQANVGNVDNIKIYLIGYTDDSVGYIDPPAALDAPTADGTFYDVDISGIIPDGAVGVGVLLANSSSTSYWGGVRQVDSTSTLTYGRLYQNRYLMNFSGCSSGRHVEVARGNTAVSFYVSAYFKSPIKFLTNPADVSLETDSEWLDINATGVVDTGSTAVIGFMRNSSTSVSYAADVRPNGSNVDDSASARVGLTWVKGYLMPLDGDLLFEGYVSNVAADHYILGWYVSSEQLSETLEETIGIADNVIKQFVAIRGLTEILRLISMGAADKLLSTYFSAQVDIAKVGGSLVGFVIQSYSEILVFISDALKEIQKSILESFEINDDVWAIKLLIQILEETIELLDNLQKISSLYKTLFDTLILIDTIRKDAVHVIRNRINLIPPDPSCVLRLSFEEGEGIKANDSSIYGNDGTISGAKWVDGPTGKGKALSFDGTTNLVNCGSDDSLKPTKRAVIEFWAYISAYSATTKNHFMGFQQAMGYTLWQYGSGGAAITWVMELNNVGGRRYGDVPLGLIPLNTWTHVVLVFDAENGILQAYKNGVLYIQRDVAVGDIVYSGEFYVGYGFESIIDETRVYNRILSTDEIATLYDQGENRYLTKAVSKIPTLENISLISQTINDIAKDISETITIIDSKIKGIFRDLRERIDLVPPDPSCVLRLSFEEGEGTVVNDSSLYGNVGTINGASWVDGSDGKGKALSFNGINNRIEIPDDSSLELTDKITLAAWIYFNGDTEGVQRHVIARADNWRFGYNYSLNNTFGFYAPAPYSAGWLTGVVPSLEWHYVSFTYDGSRAILYMDGEELNSENATGNLAFNQYIFIGAYGGTTYPFDGIIDEVRIYNRALSADEIEMLYDQGENRYLTKAVSKIPALENITLTDYIMKDFAGQISETLTVSDSILKAAGKQLRDEMGIGENIIKAVSKFPTPETSILLDTQAKGVARSLTDSITWIDVLSIIKGYNRTYNETILTRDTLFGTDWNIVKKLILDVQNKEIYMNTVKKRIIIDMYVRDKIIELLRKQN